MGSEERSCENCGTDPCPKAKDNGESVVVGYPIFDCPDWQPREKVTGTKYANYDQLEREPV